MPDLDWDGWIRCDLGHRHWGRFGAAGLLSYARDDAGQTRVLLQRRSWWSSHGGTWGLFGGARRRHESAAAAALREVYEECGLPGDAVRIQGVLRDDHGRWAYETLVGEVSWPVPPVGPVSSETAEAALVAVGAVETLDLHPGLAAVWPVLRGALMPVVIIVDGANVVGARADGWWRDRAGAAARLRDELSALAVGGIASLPAEAAAPALDRWFPEIVLVLEGAARAAPAPPSPGPPAHPAPPGQPVLPGQPLVPGPRGQPGVPGQPPAPGARGQPGLSRESPAAGPGGQPGLPGESPAAGPGGQPGLSRESPAAGPGGQPGLPGESPAAGPRGQPDPPGRTGSPGQPPSPGLPGRPRPSGVLGTPPQTGRAVQPDSGASPTPPPRPSQPSAEGLPRAAHAVQGPWPTAASGSVAGVAVRVVAAAGSGDDAIAKLARDLHGRRLVVTADRELRRRCQDAGATVTGPRWLLSLL